MRAKPRIRSPRGHIYLPARSAFLKANPTCSYPKCEHRSEDLHHRPNSSATRNSFMDESNWIALCGPHHEWVTLHRTAALAMGLAQWGWEYRQARQQRTETLQLDLYGRAPQRSEAGRV